VKVLVQEGIVELRRPTASSRDMVRLSASMSGIVADAVPIKTSVLPPAELKREMIWREGRLVFQGEPLSEAAAQFARYSDTQVVIDDPGLAREEISGSFQAHDPVGFGRAAAEALRAHVEVSDGEVRLYR
jgi:transmembrane sensor